MTDEAWIKELDFRETLEEITGPGTSVSEWLAEIANLHLSHPHTICQVEYNATFRFNCFMYALRLHQSNMWLTSININIEKSVELIDSCFLGFLRRRGAIVRHDLTLIREGTIVIYENYGLIAHAGVTAANGRITSKWGDGLLFNHEPQEVPSSYGTASFCFEQPDPELLKRLTYEYVEFMGR